MRSQTYISLQVSWEGPGDYTIFIGSKQVAKLRPIQHASTKGLCFWLLNDMGQSIDDALMGRSIQEAVPFTLRYLGYID